MDGHMSSPLDETAEVRPIEAFTPTRYGAYLAGQLVTLPTTLENAERDAETINRTNRILRQMLPRVAAEERLLGAMEEVP